MTGITQLLNNFYGAVASLSLNTSLWIAWGSYAAIFILALILTLCNSGVRRADKRAFLSFTNAFTAVTLALMLTEKEVPVSVITAVLFWCIGYILYGLLYVLTNGKTAKRQVPSAATALSSVQYVPQAEPPAPHTAPAKGNVRLEHALSVTEKLLSGELGRGDRQEVERIKTTLGVLQSKPSLSPEENEGLNENFNLLLKLMAKYNL